MYESKVRKMLSDKSFKQLTNYVYCNYEFNIYAHIGTVGKCEISSWVIYIYNLEEDGQNLYSEEQFLNYMNKHMGIEKFQEQSESGKNYRIK